MFIEKGVAITGHGEFHTLICKLPHWQPEGESRSLSCVTVWVGDFNSRNTSFFVLTVLFLVMRQYLDKKI